MSLDDVSILLNQLRTNTSELNGKVKQITNIADRINDLEKRVGNLKNSSSTQSSTYTIEERLNQLENTVSSLSSDIEEIKTKIN